MELHVDVVNVFLKTPKRFKLHCKAEESGSGEIQIETSLGNLIGSSSGNSLSQTTLLPKFRFLFRGPSPNLVALLFTATTSDNGAVEIGRCLFPITFRGSAPTNITPLDLAAVDIMKQTQLALLTTQVEDTAINKVVGKVWFKVSNRKPAPKPKLKNKQSILDLKIVQEQLQLPSSPVPSTGPVISELVARESESSCLGPSPIDKPTITVVFHCVRSATRYTASELNPIACIGRNPDIKNDTLFNDSGQVAVIPALKMVTLKCRNQEEFVELHLTNNTLIFSATHQIRSLIPFKHYNWEYNWRWRLEPGMFNPSHSQSAQEPAIMVSLVHRPAISDYFDYEGLEVLVHGIEINPSLENKSVVVCARLSSGSSSERFHNETDRRASTSDNVNISVIRFKSVSTMITIPAYYFFPADLYFDSTRNTRTKLSITLYVTDDTNTQLWWETREIASASLTLPVSIQRVLHSPGNQLGVYWELTSEDITQSLVAPVTTKISGVIRWKEKQLQFMTSEIEARMKDLPAIDDLVFTEPTTAMPSVTSTPTHIARSSIVVNHTSRQSDVLSIPAVPNVHDISGVTEADYKAALHKLGMDIMALRLENRALRQENDELEKHKRTIVMGTSTVDQAKLQSLAKTDLIFKVLELSRHLSSEIEGRKSYQKEVMELHDKLMQKIDREAEYMRLQEVHVTQQKLVRELQTKVEKYRKCYDTCNQQETVINRLESLLAAQNHSDTVSVLSKENARLRETINEHQRNRVAGTKDSLQKKDETIRSLSSELARITEKCRRLEERCGTSVTPELPRLELNQLHRQNSRIDELEGKLKVVTAREDALMSELARNWVQEKAQYEVKLAEYQKKLEHLERRLLDSQQNEHTSHHRSARQDRNHSPQASSQRNRHHFRDRRDSKFVSF